MTHSYILKKDPPPQCEHSAQTRNGVFGRCGVVESLRSHPELGLKILRDSDFIHYFS